MMWVWISSPECSGKERCTMLTKWLALPTEQTHFRCNMIAIHFWRRMPALICSIIFHSFSFSDLPFSSSFVLMVSPPFHLPYCLLLTPSSPLSLQLRFDEFKLKFLEENPNVKDGMRNGWRYLIEGVSLAFLCIPLAIRPKEMVVCCEWQTCLFAILRMCTGQMGTRPLLCRSMSTVVRTMPLVRDLHCVWLRASSGTARHTSTSLSLWRTLGGGSYILSETWKTWVFCLVWCLLVCLFIPLISAEPLPRFLAPYPSSSSLPSLPRYPSSFPSPHSIPCSDLPDHWGWRLYYHHLWLWEHWPQYLPCKHFLTQTVRPVTTSCTV